MNRVILRVLLVAVLGLPTDGLAVTAAGNEKGSAVLREQIDSLLKRRRRPEPLPLDPPNPFVLLAPIAGGLTRPATPSDRMVPVESTLRSEPTATETAEALARFASRLRIGGMIRIKDQVQIIINDVACREGDYITVERAPRMIRLQVLRILPGQLTLRLDEAELVLRF